MLTNFEASFAFEKRIKFPTETQCIADQRQCKPTEMLAHSKLAQSCCFLTGCAKKCKKIRLHNLRKFALSSLTLCHATAMGCN